MRKIYSYLLAVVAAAVLAIPASAQKISISGQVLDASDGQPLIMSSMSASLLTHRLWKK